MDHKHDRGSSSGFPCFDLVQTCLFAESKDPCELGLQEIGEK